MFAYREEQKNREGPFKPEIFATIWAAIFAAIFAAILVIVQNSKGLTCNILFWTPRLAGQMSL